LGIELPQSGWRPHNNHTKILCTCFAQQATGVQQAFAGVEVKLDAGHLINAV
jgi:hypothetical protein